MIKKLKYQNKKYTVGIIEAMFLLFASCLASFFVGYNLNSKNNNQDIEKDIYIERFEKNYNYIIDNYYKKIDKSKLIDDAIAGMMEALDDPYSVYLDKNDSNSLNISLNGVYKGLGFAIAKNDDNNIIVVGVFDNSPASAAGIIEGDIIVKINDKDVNEMSIKEFSSYVLENESDDFELIIKRNDEEKNVKITKSNVTIDSVSSKVIEEDNKKIGYIYISVFANNTSSQFNRKLIELEKDDIDALIIDVRDNTGGYLSTVETILEKLLTKDQIIYQLKTNKKTVKLYGKVAKNKKYDIYLLGNENSASASELLIASIKENLNSKFVGKKTYGKGTVQEMVPINEDKNYKITTKKWLTPKGHWVNETKGIIPDYEIDLDDSENDKQLEKVIELIKSKEK